MYRASFLFALSVAGRGDILVVGNPSNERNNWKGKCEAMEPKCLDFLKELSNLQEKAKFVDALQEEAKIHGFPQTLSIRIIEIESSLEADKNGLR